MNAPLRFAAKACLVTAACGVLSMQVAGLFAQDNDTSSTGKPKAAKIKQVQATSQDATDQGGQPSSQPESDIQKQLRKIYSKNGREMPSMRLEDLPNTQTPAPAQAGAASGAAGKPNLAVQQPGQQPSVQPAKPNWFERTFHIGRGRKQPAPANQYAAPVAPPTAPYRYPSTAPAARPAPQLYRGPVATAPVTAGPTRPAPVIAGPAATASPAQPQFREPAPLGPPPAARDVAGRGTPPSVRPARPRKDSQPLLDESGVNGDSESLELEDDDAHVTGQAPKVLPSDTVNGPAESPYSGIKISPNQTEQQFVSSRSRIEPADETLSEKAASNQASKDSGAADKIVEELAQPAEKSVPRALASAKPESGKLAMQDDGDDQDDEDEEDTLSLSAKEPRKHADAPIEKTEKAADKPVAPAPFSGLKGICPVVLKDNRKLLDAQPEIKSEFHGKTYTFSSLEAKKAFDENPRKYAPAGGGADVVRLTSGEADIAGTLEHAAWYRGRLYLFSTADTRSVFVETPSKFVIED